MPRAKCLEFRAFLDAVRRLRGRRPDCPRPTAGEAFSDYDANLREAAMTRWMYKRVTFDIVEVSEEPFEKKLNELGEQGWELVSTFDRERGGNSKECFVLFKRPASG